jgi:Protein of unknown function (DUF1592)/Protein of unknown function (DUF1588)/Protein of unknown function (DUF1585)/Protein of unknown function (DUF1587)/Protein of unknown function (DUF1595)
VCQNETGQPGTDKLILVLSLIVRSAIILLPLISASFGAPGSYSFEESQAFLKSYCQACHQGKSAVGGFNLDRVNTPASFQTQPQRWAAANRRVKNGEMPPKGAPAPSLDLRERFSGWVEETLRAEACSGGIAPGPSPIRRLNRSEYTATVRDLLDIHLDVGHALPADGAGGEGFDNAAETLFLSPLHSEKYMEVAKLAMNFAAKEYKSRVKILVATPGKGVTESQAAREILTNFLPRAFRRPVTEADIAPYLALFHAARKHNEPFEASVFFALRGALVSPLFLFRTEPPNTTTEPRPLDQYAMASRLSYFLWGSMPDEFLFDIAAAGKLQEPEVLRELVRRMLRNDRSLDFAQRFIEQWLHTRDLLGDKAPDAKLFPTYAMSEDLRSDIRLQPVMFFRELLVKDLSLLNLIDSTHTIGTSNLAKHFDLKLPLRPNQNTQPHWVELPQGSRRGGLLGMPAVLAVSSYPYRTSPVLRGAWVLDSLLGTPPPPPPPNVPALEEHKEGAAPTTLRERLERHRADPVCASCHSRIDGLGFALENYDVVGRWREEEAGKPVDNSGELADGTKFKGPDELKAMLLDRKDLFLRNLTSKMLGYALGRGLTLKDSCTVDAIVSKLRDNGFNAQTLIEEIVLSVPFRYQAASSPVAVPTSQRSSSSPTQKEQ